MVSAAGPWPLPSMPWQVAQTVAYMASAWLGSLGSSPCPWLGPVSGLALNFPDDGGGGSPPLLHASPNRRLTRRPTRRLRMGRRIVASLVAIGARPRAGQRGRLRAGRDDLQ